MPNADEELLKNNYHRIQKQNRNFFLANSFRDEDEILLAQKLGLPLFDLYKLGLCRRPVTQEDYTNIASQFGIGDAQLKAVCPTTAFVKCNDDDDDDK